MSQSPAQLKRYNGLEWELINETLVGGVNLIVGSASHTITGDSADTYWIAADELKKGFPYTFSVDEIRLNSGTTLGASWALVNQNNSSVA